MKKKVVLWSTAIVIAGIALAALAFMLVWNGVVLLNNPSSRQYPVRGVDVSSYQGEIDWQMLASQKIAFAFIKATEGSSFVDPCFAYNYEQAQTTDLRVGAYHFFSYDSEGATQADNFIATVEKTDNMLPPVIDLEFYGDKASNPPARDAVQVQLDALLTRLEAHYGMKPIIYATETSYALYLDDAYKEYDIWIRNVITKPTLSDDRNWTFWQYTNREHVDGYKGEEKFIDFNVFQGNAKDFENYAK